MTESTEHSSGTGAHEYSVLPAGTVGELPQRRSSVSKRSLTAVCAGIAAVGVMVTVVLVAFRTRAPEMTEQAPELSASWSLVAQLPDDTPHEVIFVIKEKDGHAVEDLILDRANPDSPHFRQWFSKDEVKQIVRDEVSHVVVNEFLAAWDGVTVVRSSDLFIRARATASLWSKMFGSALHEYKQDDGTLRARADSLTLPSVLGGHVVGVLNWLDVGVQPPSRVRRELEPVADGARTFPGYVTPARLHEYYGVPETVAGSSDVEFQEATTQMAYASIGQSWSPSDLNQFQQEMSLPQRPVTESDSNGQHSGRCSGFSQCGEANLDVQQLSGMSPWSATSFYYMNSHTTFEAFLEQVQQMSPPPQVISISYGSIEYYTSQSLITAFDNVAKSLSLQGTTILASSGDDGANNMGRIIKGDSCEQVVEQYGLSVNWPASSPWVTGVGATMGVESDSPETVCAVNEEDSRGGKPAITSGGGYSKKIQKPSWQTGVSGNMRGVPDLSAAGHNFVVQIAGKATVEDGTSASCPVMAGMISLINAELNKVSVSLESESTGLCETWTGGTCWWSSCHASRGETTCQDGECLCEPGFCAVDGRCVPSSSSTTTSPAHSGSVGFINPIIYRNPGAFNDVTQGNNKCTSHADYCCAGYDAGPGWDAVTGLGSPKFEAFKSALLR
uniref:subtilisin n=1 Tax=Noctiluca scintillans TaxID=2966 RepID=A0A7S1A4J3_NOCSC|mmetsp:Transcript_31285/g.83240  ORF Transcript_31285/g.83240 Transcript_31285/m.83240 type:complete len:672 (+) Transcript_31285:65-2080(+)